MTVAVRQHRSPIAVRVGRVVLGVVALVAVAVLVLVVLIPQVTGGAARFVRSGSMAPAIPKGALALDRPVTAAQLHPGDVATYGVVGDDGRKVVVTHRVVAVDRSVTPALVTFRGDANRTDDPQRIPISDVRGRVWLVLPGVGTARDWWPLLASALAGAVAVAWFANAFGPRRAS
jgi:signal peptidase